MLRVDFGNVDSNVNFSDIEKYNFVGVDGDGAVVLYEKIPHFVNGENCKKSEEENRAIGMWINASTGSMILINRLFKLTNQAGKLFRIDKVLKRNRVLLCTGI